MAESENASEQKIANDSNSVIYLFVSANGCDVSSRFCDQQDNPNDLTQTLHTITNNFIGNSIVR